MPVEENKELRDLVTETLKNKGILGKVQAEIRASVFLALEEQDVFKDKSPFVNKPLREFLKTSEGLLAVSLVREFLEFFNLEFTSTVFEPETHAGIDYSYGGRSKLAKDLMLSDKDKSAPLLSYVIEQLKSENNTSRTTDFRKEQSSKTNNESLNLLNFTLDGPPVNGFANVTLDRTKNESKDASSSSKAEDTVRLETKIENSRTRQPINNSPKETTSLASLSNLPPLGKKNNPLTQRGNDLYNLKSLVDFKLADSNSANSSLEESLKENSDESEIEEELSNQSNVSGHAGNSDNTVDVSLSKASGIGDYMEDV